MSASVKLDVESFPGYLCIRTHGVWSQDTSGEYLKELVATITGSRQTNILIDNRDLKYDSSIFSDYLATREMELLEPPGFKRTAVIEKSEIKSNVEMFEMGLRNLGINARFFFDKQEALKWLEGEDYKNQEAV